MTDKPEFLFVGTVSRPADGTLGGQLFACTLLLASGLSELVTWRVIDSSQKSQPPPPPLLRAWPAFVRVCRSVSLLVRPSVKGGLLFASYQPFSLMEKLLVCLVGRLLGKRMVISFRSEIRPLGKIDRLLHPLLRMALRAPTRVICQSGPAASALTGFCPGVESRIVIVPNWIDPSMYEVPPRSQRAEDAVPTLLFIGWLEKNKGVHDLLEALALLRDRGRRFRALIGGSGSQHRPLMEQATRLGLQDRMEFRGWIAGDDKARAFAEADVFVLPSYSEGMPNSVLEAMACGLPVVSTTVGGVPELVTKDGSVLVAPGARADLAEALEPLLTDSQRRVAMGKANRGHIEREHNITVLWSRIAAAMGINPVQLSSVSNRCEPHPET